MIKKVIRLYVLGLLVLILAACNNKSKDTNPPVQSNPQEGEVTNENSNGEAHPESQENDIELVKMTYTYNEIQAHYPQLSSGLEEQKRDVVNQIIQNDMLAIVDIYSADIAPNQGTEGSEAYEFILTIDYEVKLQNYNYLSICYVALYNSVTAAYPSEMVYTTNIDLVNQSRLKLTDMVTLNDDFVTTMKTWNFITYEQDNEELKNAIDEYIHGISNAQLLEGLKAADQIGTNNTYGIYGYLTEEKLGIAISVPHVLGDYVRFERDYKKLDQLKLEIE